MTLKEICHCGHSKTEHETVGDWEMFGTKNYFWICKGITEKFDKNSGETKKKSCKCNSYSETPFQVTE